MSGYNRTIIITTLSRSDYQWIKYAIDYCIDKDIFWHRETWLNTLDSVLSVYDTLDYQKNELGVGILPEEGLDVMLKALVGWMNSGPDDCKMLKYHFDPIIEKIEDHPDYK